MADVFVSYSRSDKARVAPLVAAIEAKGWSVWWDPDIDPGQEFDRRIAAELEAATAVLVVWTSNSVESRWVRGEARDGAERGILVPVRLGGVRLPIDVRAFHTTDLDGWGDDPASPQVEQVLRALDAIVGRPRARESAAATAEPTRLPSRSGAASAAGSSRVAICVLPFANMSGDPEQAYFSDGITEDIITDLSKISALSVIARNSAFVYKGKHVDIPKVARELKVSHVLEGSVRKAGTRVRITAQLVDGATNDHLWAERYDRDLNDIFALQDAISEAIVAALKVKLLPAEKKAIEQRGTSDPEAYNLYLMARQFYVNGHDNDTVAALAVLRLSTRATELDADYARAWALLAIARRSLHFIGKSTDDGMTAAERALALDPDLADAHAAKARILLEHGHNDEAAARIEIALRLDPESYEVRRTAGKVRYRQLRLGEAIEHYEKASAMLEADIHASEMLIGIYTAVGDSPAALRCAKVALARAEKATVKDANNAQALAVGASALAALGEGERAKEWMSRAMLIDPDNFNARYNFACALAAQLKDNEGALEWLRPVFATITASALRHVRIDPDFANIRGDPRFKAMVEAAEARVAGSDQRTT